MDGNGEILRSHFVVEMLRSRIFDYRNSKVARPAKRVKVNSGAGLTDGSASMDISEVEGDDDGGLAALNANVSAEANTPEHFIALCLLELSLHSSHRRFHPLFQYMHLYPFHEAGV